MMANGIRRKWIIFYFLFAPLAVYSAQTPIITSAVNITVPGYNAFTFQVTATNNPTSFSATGLPPGLSINTQTGLISGSMNLEDFGSYIINLTATNAAGTANGGMIMFTPLNAVPILITSPSTDQATVGIPYQYQITTTGNTSSFGALNLPPGLSIGSSTGQISGTPTVQGSYLIYIAASGPQVAGSEAILLLTVNPGSGPLPTITSGANSSGQVGIPYSYTISGTNITAGYMAAGLPPGLSFNAGSGSISGTPTLAGTYTMLVSALNNNGSGSQIVTLTIAPPATQLPVITSPSTALGIANFEGIFTPYQITATGNPTSFDATGLPPGLNFDPLTAQIYGTPSQAGTFSVTVSASNSAGTASMPLSYNVEPAGTAPPIPSNPAPAEVRAGSVSGNPGTTVDLPIYYTPSPDIGANSLQFNVVAPPHVRLVSCGLEQTAVDASFTPFCTPPVGQGGAFSVGTWANLGPGLAMVVHLQIDSGIPGGTFPIHLVNPSMASQYNTVNNTLGEVIVPVNAVDGTVTILGSVAPPAPNLSVSPTGTITFNATVGGANPVAQSVTLSNTGTAASNWSVSSDQSWLTAGTLSGTIPAATNPGPSVSINVSVGSLTQNTYIGHLTFTDQSGVNQVVTVNFIVGAGSAGGVPVITSALTAPAVVGQAFSYTIQATNSPTSFSVTGGFPPGLSLNAATGAITGTPTAAGTWVESMTATNSVGTSNPALLTITITNTPPPAPVITSPDTASGTVGQSFSYTIVATNSPFNYNAIGDLPVGVNLNTATGAITGTPSAPITTTLTINATNFGGTGTAPLTITINPPASVITSADTASGVAGEAFSYTITASNNPTSFGITGTLSAGLSLDSATGAITGTPSATGTTVVFMTATNAEGTSTPVQLTITINPPVPVITSADTASGVVGQAFSYTITASNSPTTYGITGTTLPAGLTLDSATGAITGTPSAAGTTVVSMTATNAGGTSAPVQLTITITNTPPPAPVITSADSVSGTVGQSFTYTITATNIPNSFGITGTLPAGLSLNTGTGAITGTPSAAGTTVVSMIATNAGGTSAPVQLTITISNAPPPAPVITSAGTASGVAGQAFSYTITASNSPTSFGITGTLPAGLSLDSTTGAITGTPTSVGTTMVSMTATNAGGTSASVPLTITISNAPPPAPVITSAGTASGVVGQAFSYTITASNSPTSFGITGTLPAGLALDSVTGAITGTPTTAGSASVTMTATNTGGTDPEPLTITINTASNTGTLPVPDISGLNGGTFLLTDQLAFNYPISGVTFGWSFTPTSVAPGAASLASPVTPLASGAPVATTAVPRFTPASLGLQLGTYALTVTVTQGSQTQPSAPATITLIGSDLSSVKIYPNPWRSDKHAAYPKITFAGLTSATTIKIFTVAGHEIKELQTTTGSDIAWDLTNDSGDKVASGFYLYLITDSQGDKIRGKLAVIR